MGLKIFNRYSCGCPALGDRMITVGKFSGRITITKKLANELHLLHNSPILFAQDEDSAKKWFVSFPKKDLDGAFRLRKSGASLVISAKVVAQDIVNSIDESQEIIRFLVGIVPQKHNGIEFLPLVPVIVNK